ncbi:long-chain fatty acid transporter [Mesorhizobium sp. CU2]|uniref:OmpP1/FadL family transporter n=1 Tax=unclassified Mesorhizobium TaxID=325217 RepID=UPI00112986FF|nr:MULTISPECIES: outer membrane protein transport protein [unclassified Mesorhizobium]TPN81094.1 long-chain fatty acid transporter [Mesorhizobium sp. CU3]TPO11685.1 long-chain fatty acid transporter [Mesorhizobium sp. CU2]
MKGWKGELLQISKPNGPFLALVLACSCFALPVLAGGYSEGEANTDVLYEDSPFITQSSLVYVYPRRDYSSLMGHPVDDKPYSDSYVIPNLAVAARLGDNLSCEFTYTRPFGGSATYSQAAQNAEFATAMAQGDPFPNPTSAMKFSADEYGTACAARIEAGPGKLYAIGGLFWETFDYKEDTWIGSVHLKDDGKLGYRLGVGYDIPDYALRVQLLYRSQVKHEGSGSYTPSEFAIENGITDMLPARGSGTLPQSVKLYAQTGVAPGWLVYGSATWTQWSVLQAFSYDVIGLGTANKVFNYTDGYTLQLGVGHEFDSKLSGTVNLTWDQGVGTGADITTDTWTLGLGAEYKTDLGTFSLGAGLSYLTAGAQRVASGATYDASANADWALSGALAYTLKF